MVISWVRRAFSISLWMLVHTHRVLISISVTNGPTKTKQQTKTSREKNWWHEKLTKSATTTMTKSPFAVWPTLQSFGCDVYLDVLTLEYLCVRAHIRSTPTTAPPSHIGGCPINIRIYDRKECRIKFICVNLYAICEWGDNGMAHAAHNMSGRVCSTQK